MIQQALTTKPRASLQLPKSRTLTWAIVGMVLAGLLGVSIIARLALVVAAPQHFFYPDNLLAKIQADYSYWPSSPLLPALNPLAAAAPEEDEQPAPPNQRPGRGVPVAVVGPAQTATPTPSLVPPTATPTAAPAVTATPQQATALLPTATQQVPTPVAAAPVPPTLAPAAAVPPAATQADPLPPASTATQPVATATSSPASTATSTFAPPATRTPAPTATQAATRTPVPTATRLPAPAPPPPIERTPAPVATRTLVPTATRPVGGAPEPIATPIVPPALPPTAISTAQPTATATATTTATAMATATTVPTAVPFAPPAIRINPERITAPEGAGAVTITVELDRAVKRNVRLNYTTSDENAIADRDYTSRSGTLNIAPGETTQRLVISLIDDQRDEADKTFRVVFSNAVSALLPDPSFVTITIEDDDPPPQIVIDDVRQPEGTNTQSAAFFTVRLSEASERTVRVAYTTIADSARASDDYTPITGELVFAPNTTHLQISVPIKSDALDEQDERFFVDLSNAVNATIAKARGTATIIDDDDPPRVRLAAAASTVVESAGQTSITVRLDVVSGRDVTVPYTVTGTASSPADHTLRSGTAMVPAGALEQTILFNITNDAVDEGNETIVVTLSSPSNATLGTPAKQTIMIRDNDRAAVTIASTAPLVTTEDGDTANFTVRLASQPTAPVMMTFASKNQREGLVATPPLTFTTDNWNTPQTVTVRGVDDEFVDGDVGYKVAGTASSTDAKYDRVAVPPVQLTNRDNDRADIRISDATVTEGVSKTVRAVFTVTLSQPSANPMQLGYATKDGSATAGSDYQASTGTLSILAGETTAQIVVDVLADALVEPRELFLVNLTLDPATLPQVSLIKAQGRGTILDVPAVRFAQPSYTVSERAGIAALRVFLDAGVTEPVTVAYTVADGTAVQPDDYIAANGLLAFAPGQQSATISITVVDDIVVEPLREEVLWVTLADSTNALIRGPATATLVIVDDDVDAKVLEYSSFRTHGPQGERGQAQYGNWYTAADQGNGYHIATISVPCSWPRDKPVAIEIFSPGVHKERGSPDTTRGTTPDSTLFELFNPGAPPSGLPDYTQEYLPPAVNTLETWELFDTLNPVTCGTYTLRTKVIGDGDDDNRWLVRAGWNTNGNQAPPLSDADGMPGTGDEIVVGVLQATLQVPATAAQTYCVTIYEYVQPGSASVAFHNFDLDAGQTTSRVRYYGPTAQYDPLALNGGTLGTPSLATTWNNGTLQARGAGDVINAPEAGWWRIVTCTSGTPDSEFDSTNNRFIQEGQTDVPGYYAQPPTPVLTATLNSDRDAASVGDVLTYTLTVSNISSGMTAGAALNAMLTVNLPPGVTSAGSTTVTFTTNTALAAGATQSFTFPVTIGAEARGLLTTTLDLDYRDILDNRYGQRWTTQPAQLP